jgi:osmotically-inducible protein OsmY
MNKQKTRTAVASLVCAVILIVGSAVVYAADAPDPWLTMKTKVALLTADNLSTSELNVDTVKGVVTLHGKVPTEPEKQRAEQIAMKIDGVKSVKNLLQVVPNSRHDVVQRSDADIKEGVDAAFKANHRIDDSGIKVASVNNGVVLLAGKTKSMEAHVEAVEVARAVRGVKRVSSEVVVQAPTTH